MLKLNKFEVACEYERWMDLLYWKNILLNSKTSDRIMFVCGVRECSICTDRRCGFNENGVKYVKSVRAPSCQIDAEDVARQLINV